MLIRLRIFGALERYLGGDRHEVELRQGATVRDLMDLIDERWGDELPSQFWDPERKRFQGPVLIMSEGVDVLDQELPLADQQQLMILVPLSGG
jgi:molybdopterin converting factor small subunit